MLWAGGDWVDLTPPWGTSAFQHLSQPWSVRCALTAKLVEVEAGSATAIAATARIADYTCINRRRGSKAVGDACALHGVGWEVCCPRLFGMDAGSIGIPKSTSAHCPHPGHITRRPRRASASRHQRRNQLPFVRISAENENMRSLCFSLVAGLGIALGACNNPMLLVDVEIDYQPMGTTQLVVVTTVNGQPGREQHLPPDQRRIAIHLPQGSSGTVGVRVYGMDAGECILTEGSLEAEVPTSFNRTEQHRIQMARPSDTKKCSFTALSPGLPSLPYLYAVWGSDPNNMFVVGARAVDMNTIGVVLHCSTSSTECLSLDGNILSNNLATNTAVWGSDPNHVFVVNRLGHVLRCSAESHTCTSIYQAMGASFETIWGSDSENIYAGGNSSFPRIHRCSATTNACGPMASMSSVVSSIWGSSSDHVYAVDSDRMKPEVVRCRTSSTTCDQLPLSASPASPYLRKVWGSDPLNVYAVGDAGTIVRCTAATSVCTPLNSGTTARLNSVWGSDAENVYAVGDGVIVRCRAGSDTCQPMSLGTASTFKAVWGSDANNVYVVGNNGTIVRCSAGSNACVTLTSGVAANLFSVFGTDSNNIYVVGDGTILRRRL